MGVRRYSTDPKTRRRQEFLDHLQWRCTIHGDPITIGEIVKAGITRAEWVCRDYDCWHRSEPVDLTRFGDTITVTKLRWKFVCSKCGTGRPAIELLWD
jgi:hypothetical protein